MSDHFVLHKDYVEIIDTNYTIADAFHLLDEAAGLRKEIPAPPEGYHILEDLTRVTNVTAAAHIIVRTLLGSTPLHCIALFGGAPEIVTKREFESKEIGKESIHHYFKTREEAVDWMTKNHNFERSNEA
jgi:hypothetical protein